MHISFNKTIILATSLFILSCGNKNSDNVEDIEDDEQIKNETQIDAERISAQNVFNALPQRKQVLDIVMNANAQYDPSFLNNPDNIKGYKSESTVALNFGVYGTDLNITNVFEQTQESMLFLSNVNLLAKNLGVSNSFDEKMMNRMDAHKDNRDSTLSIISHAFRTTDDYLVSTNRAGTSALIVAGSWIEGMYVASCIAKETNSTEAIAAIFEQKESLRYLIELLQASKVNEKVDYLINDLKEIQTILSEQKESVFNLKTLRPLELKITTLREKITTPN